MTLQEVAEQVRQDSRDHSSAEAEAIAFSMRDVVQRFESDPDFTLRERVEKLAERIESAANKSFDPGSHIYADIARRLREVLGK